MIDDRRLQRQPGWRVRRKDSGELGVVTSIDFGGIVQVQWDDGKTSSFKGELLSNVVRADPPSFGRRSGDWTIERFESDPVIPCRCLTLTTGGGKRLRSFLANAPKAGAAPEHLLPLRIESPTARRTAMDGDEYLALTVGGIAALLLTIAAVAYVVH
jgi:hypothetical protein